MIQKQVAFAGSTHRILNTTDKKLFFKKTLNRPLVNLVFSEDHFTQQYLVCFYILIYHFHFHFVPSTFSEAIIIKLLVDGNYFRCCNSKTTLIYNFAASHAIPFQFSSVQYNNKIATSELMILLQPCKSYLVNFETVFNFQTL
jgi:hypothetical protein